MTDTSDHEQPTRIGRRRAAALADAGPAYQARRDEITAAAGRLFLERGYRATSFKDIGEAVGLDRATLYYYFASKQELFQTATATAVRRNTFDAERIAASDASPAEKIEAILDTLLRSYAATDYPYMFIFLQEDVNRITQASDDPWSRTVRALARRFEDAVTAVFDEGVASGAFATGTPPALLTKALIGMVNWTQRWYRPDGPVPAPELARMFGGLLLDGVRPR